MFYKRILFTKPKVAELLNYEVSEPARDEVQVKLVRSTISSGTERANLLGEVNVSVATFDTEAHFPRYCGYSSSGIVEKVGSAVTDFTVGDRVALSWSTHSKYVAIDHKNLYKILDDNVTFEEAALWHIGTFPMAAIRKCRFEIGESAIVMGMGILGLFAVKLLAASGAAPLIAVDPVKEKRELALSIGADYAFDPFDPDFAKKVKEVTNGGVNVAIEVTGNGGALNGVLDCMKRMGRVALLGCTRSSDFTIDYYHKVHGPGITLIGAHTHARPSRESSGGWWTEWEDFEALLKLTQLGRLKLSSMVEAVYSPQEAPAVYKRLCEEKTFPLTQFDWSRLT